jgi:DNA-binding transcriptional ArsR family regulator
MSDPLSRTFLALADPTRRAILAQIADGALSVNDLVLEEAGLIRRERVAKTRPVHLEPEGLKRAGAWIDHYRKYWEGAFDRMDALIQRLNEEAAKNGRQ